MIETSLVGWGQCSNSGDGPDGWCTQVPKYLICLRATLQQTFLHGDTHICIGLCEEHTVDLREHKSDRIVAMRTLKAEEDTPESTLAWFDGHCERDLEARGMDVGVVVEGSSSIQP